MHEKKINFVVDYDTGGNMIERDEKIYIKTYRFCQNVEGR
jgi:hypothetical protein